MKSSRGKNTFASTIHFSSAYLILHPAPCPSVCDFSEFGVHSNCLNNVSWRDSCLHRQFLIIWTAGSCPSLRLSHTNQSSSLLSVFLKTQRAPLMFPPRQPSIPPSEALKHSLHSKNSKRLKSQSPHNIVTPFLILAEDTQVTVDVFESLNKKMRSCCLCSSFFFLPSLSTINKPQTWVSVHRDLKQLKWLWREVEE